MLLLTLSGKRLFKIERKLPEFSRLTNFTQCVTKKKTGSYKRFQEYESCVYLGYIYLDGILPLSIITLRLELWKRFEISKQVSLLKLKINWLFTGCSIIIVWLYTSFAYTCMYDFWIFNILFPRKNCKTVTCFLGHSVWKRQYFQLLQCLTRHLSVDSRI